MNRVLSSISKSPARQLMATASRSPVALTACSQASGTGCPSSSRGLSDRPRLKRANSRKLPKAGASVNIGLCKAGRGKPLTIWPSGERRGEEGEPGGGGGGARGKGGQRGGGAATSG